MPVSASCIRVPCRHCCRKRYVSSLLVLEIVAVTGAESLELHTAVACTILDSRFSILDSRFSIHHDSRLLCYASESSVKRANAPAIPYLSVLQGSRFLAVNPISPEYRFRVSLSGENESVNDSSQICPRFLWQKTSSQSHHITAVRSLRIAPCSRLNRTRTPTCNRKWRAAFLLSFFVTHVDKSEPGRAS